MSTVTSPIDESVILKPYTYLYSNAVETAVSRWVQNMNVIIKGPQEAVQVISEVVYMVCRSLALTDDVIDKSKLRFKKPTAYEVFGVPHSLTASWISLFMAAERLLSLKQPKAVELLVKNMKRVYEGQAMEILWRDSFQCPTEKEFDQQTRLKGGGFVSLVSDLLQLFAQDERDLTKLNRLLAFWYQAQDDMEDLQLEYKLGEGGSYCEDINDGKFGFPLVIAINRHPDKLDKCDIAEKMADKTSRGSYIQSLIKESDALVCCTKILSELEAEICMELDALGGSEDIDLMLKFPF